MVSFAASSLETSFLKSTQSVLTDKNALRVIFVSILWATAHGYISPFLGTYEIKELGFSMTFVAVLTAINAGVRIIASIFLGKCADKKSFAYMLKICYCLVAVSFLAVTFTTPANGYFMFTVYTVFMGAAMGGINSAELNLIFDYVTPENQKNALAIKQSLYGVFSFCSTLAATPLLNKIQKLNLTVWGTIVYGQQVLALVSFFLAIALIVYITKLSKSNMTGKPNKSEDLTSVC